MIWKKIKKWWKNNQEKNSERYLEREEMKEELMEYKKDVEAIYNSSAMDFQERTPEKASLIQNILIQRRLKEATDGLKNATWILAIATGVFAWATIVDSPNSSYFIQTLQEITTVIGCFILLVIAVALIWKILVFLHKHVVKLLLK